MAARDRLIASAIALLQRNGVAGTGIAELLKHSGIARRSVYLNFPGGKAELIAAAAKSAGQAISEVIRGFATEADPVSAVEAFVALWKDILTGSDFDAGCPIVAAALGRAEAPAAADIAGEQFTDWECLLATRLEAANVPAETAAQLATTTIAAIEGAVIMSLATKSDVPLQRTGALLADLVAQHTRPAAARRQAPGKQATT
ncbi:TetR/AcrR family transcriptional regulator [Mycobacterium talmoniae]|uniref:Putative HTH-type transcriptional regulator n=1 Tax=Mycobacterium talmoniae TaxID=1858794 RepID=A0A1S1NGE3_9MYCO|nr:MULTISPECIES: TetR family transcriptional regulator [Mycobacterium]OHV01445.1 TetR family transcriptional regulator [Mycobacterium talmoniae]PQM48302.1 putative HTH-type transcriptional regulator [Mycobacterium talmoniae]TDH48194.1 TetR/AcrR family transcriptional regulator [Mycobacterium eburneum]